MDAGETVEFQTRAWNTENPEERIRLLELACALNATFTSPADTITGIGALSDQIGQFRRDYPSAVVSASGVSAHHGHARWDWTTRWDDSREPLTGEDFAELTTDGRIARLVTFWR